jgi:Flp pilus assembly pilin Flp
MGGGGGGEISHWQWRLLYLYCQDNGKSLGEISSFEKACNHFKRPLFHFIKFLFGRRNFQLRKKSSGATFVESAFVIALVIIAAIGGLSYLGLAVRDRLGALAGTTENKPKSMWDKFFEGVQGILDDEDETHNNGYARYDALYNELLHSLIETGMNDREARKYLEKTSDFAKKVSTLSFCHRLEVRSGAIFIFNGTSV